MFTTNSTSKNKCILRRGLSSSPIRVFLSTVAILDILSLLNDFAFIFSWDVLKQCFHLWDDEARLQCVLEPILSHWFIAASHWTLAAVSIERFVTVWFPLKARRLCTIKNSKIICASVIILCGIARLLWLTSTASYNCMFDRILSNVENVLVVNIPCAVLFVFNVLIIVRIVVREHRNSDQPISPGRNTIRVHTASRRTEDTAKQAVRMLIVTCAAFVLLCLPNGISFAVVDETNGSVEYTVRQVTFLLAKINAGINFFLYILASSTFRAEFYRLVGCRRQTLNFRFVSGKSVMTGTTYVSAPLARRGNRFLGTTTLSSSSSSSSLAAPPPLSSSASAPELGRVAADTRAPTPNVPEPTSCYAAALLRRQRYCPSGRHRPHPHQLRLPERRAKEKNVVSGFEPATPWFEAERDRGDPRTEIRKGFPPVHPPTPSRSPPSSPSPSHLFVSGEKVRRRRPPASHLPLPPSHRITPLLPLYLPPPLPLPPLSSPPSIRFLRCHKIPSDVGSKEKPEYDGREGEGDFNRKSRQVGRFNCENSFRSELYFV